ncbi:MAG: hypothetical protein INF93_14360 [Rhodobacter sp.]|jgi:hypothetical protein|nr:hypothetical protein [Rhodobacter sp.]
MPTDAPGRIEKMDPLAGAAIFIKIMGFLKYYHPECADGIVCADVEFIDKYEPVRGRKVA